MRKAGRKHIIISSKGSRVIGRCEITEIVMGDGKGFGNLAGRTGSGNVMRSQREVPPFDAIEIDSCVDVDVRFGSSQGVEIEADDNIHDIVKTHVHGSVLILDIEGSLSTNNTIRALIQLPTPLREVVVQGSGDALVQGVDQEQLSLYVRGSGDIRVDGKVQSLRARVQGSGNMKLRRLVAHTADLAIQGSGDIKAHVSSSVSAQVLGSGDIYILGEPPQRHTRVRGSGEIEFE